MELPAKRPRLAARACGDASQLPEASQSHHKSSQPSNRFEGYGVQNTGNFEVGRDFVINIDKSSKTSAEEDKLRELDKKRKTLLESLRFERMDAREWSIKRAHARTCAWFLETPAYVNWTRNNAMHNDHSFLWIKGKPGAGKSTLMKFLLEQLRDQTQQANGREILLSFFFNARGGDLEKATTGLYRSLLLQLLEARTDLHHILDRFRIGHRWTIDSLKFVFEKAVQALGDVSVVCLIDALDECDEAQIRDMILFLSDRTVARSRLRICLASRHYPHITIQTGLDIVLEAQTGHGEDIASYLGSALRIQDSALARQVRHDLQAKASGVFMWVVLVVGILNKEHDAGNDHLFREWIQKLPGDIHDLFHDIITRDGGNMDSLLLCIQWALFARHPLTPRQMYFAVLSGLEPHSLPHCHSSDISTVTIERYILNNSKGLTEVTKSHNPIVQFIHESVRDFLLKEDGLGRIWPHLSTKAVGQSHDILKQCCLNYMGMEELVSTNGKYDDGIRSRYPFLEYANLSILHHAEQAQARDISQRDFLTAFPRYQWACHHNTFEMRIPFRNTSKVSLLYILAMAGVAALIRAHPSGQSCFEVENEKYGVPILAACATKSGATIRAMLEREASLSLKSSRAGLHGLILPDLNIPKQLNTPYDTRPPALYVTHNLNPYFTFNMKRDLLHHLVDYGTEAVSLFFIAVMRCDIHAKDLNGNTILMLAARRGFIELVKALIQKSADVSAANEDGETPLYMALHKGYAEIAKLLINSGSNISATNTDGETPLHVASFYGHTKTVKLLINSGSNISATNTDGETPLHIASFYGHTKTVKLLINNGSNISAVTKYGKTPLCIASHTDIVKLLINSGSNNYTGW